MIALVITNLVAILGLGIISALLIYLIHKLDTTRPEYEKPYRMDAIGFQWTEDNENEQDE